MKESRQPLRLNLILYLLSWILLLFTPLSTIMLWFTFLLLAGFCINGLILMMGLLKRRESVTVKFFWGLITFVEWASLLLFLFPIDGAPILFR